MERRDNAFVGNTRIDRLAAWLVYKAQDGATLPRWILRIFFRVEFMVGSRVGPGLKLLHAGTGHLVHSNVVIGSDVVLGPYVAIGAKNDLRAERTNGRVIISDHVIIAAGAVITLRSDYELRIGEGTIVGANSVLTQSTGDWEVWVGVPARKLK
ncbi:MAG TPA: hypothetical protein VHC41_06040 [Mycobacteriales bacterium]|nr:hypothetical protein [Mycobacteriales bacterium]